MSPPEEDPTWLTDGTWQWVCSHVPIACADVLPVRRDPQGVVRQVGLIRRVLEDREVWCQVGGRVHYAETTREAAQRHLRETLRFVGDAHAASAPFFVNEFFPDIREGLGHDPRKHAVAVCYAVDLPADVEVRDAGEALCFRWFDIGSTPPDAALWPGAGAMLNALVLNAGHADPELSYETVNARAVSHNELMWQTPLLAMTAMAFLMTIALGDGEPWQRATAAMLSAVTAFVSVQLMAKHSLSQREDADRLSALEDRLGLMPVHRRPERTDGWLARRLGQLEGWMVRWRSRQWWLVAMLLFGVVSLVIGVLAVVGI